MLRERSAKADSTMFLWLIFCSCAVVLTSANSNSGTKNKPVVTHLSAKWPSTPLLLETAEYMSEENPATFWTFVDDVATWDAESYSKSVY